MICAMIYNVNRPEGSPPAKAEDFLPNEGPQTEKQLRAAMTNIMSTLGGGADGRSG